MLKSIPSGADRSSQRLQAHTQGVRAHRRAARIRRAADAALAYLPLAVVWDSRSGNLLHAALSVCNVILLAYAVRTFIGWRATREDASPLLTPLAAATSLLSGR